MKGSVGLPAPVDLFAVYSVVVFSYLKPGIKVTLLLASVIVGKM